MDRKELQETLKSLHAQLNSASTIDDQTRALLTTLAADIQRLSEQEVRESESEVESLTGQVQDIVQKFGSEHPQLARALNQVSAALANLGI